MKDRPGLLSSDLGLGPEVPQDCSSMVLVLVSQLEGLRLAVCNLNVDIILDLFTMATQFSLKVRYDPNEK